MKKLLLLCLLFILLFTLWNCKKSKENIKLTIKDSTSILKEKVKETNYINYIIEDFNPKKNTWIESYDESCIGVFTCQPELGILYYNFENAKYNKITEPFINFTMFKEIDLSNFNGIIIKAKSDHKISTCIQLLEKSVLSDETIAYEIWHDQITLTPGWNAYKIIFTNLSVEEYWEQNFIGNDILQLKNIGGINLKITPNKSTPHKKGNIYIDIIAIYDPNFTVSIDNSEIIIN